MKDFSSTSQSVGSKKRASYFSKKKVTECKIALLVESYVNHLYVCKIIVSIQCQMSVKTLKSALAKQQLLL